MQSWQILGERKMYLTLRQMEAFLAVANLRSFTAAGKSLHITQSATSALVKELEEQTGLCLFDRTSRFVALSPDGQNFFPIVQKAFQECMLAENLAQAMKKQRSAFVRVVGAPLIACTLLPLIIADFAHFAPEIHVQIVDQPMSLLQQSVAKGDADVGFGPERHIELDICAEIFFKTPVSLVSRKDHPFVGNRPHWEQVKQEPFIAVGAEMVSRLEAEVGGSTPFNVAHVVDQMSTAFALVAARRGIVVAGPFCMLLARGYGLTVTPCEPVVWRNMLLYTHQNRPLSPAAAAFVAFANSFVQQHNPNALAGKSLADLVDMKKI